MSRKAKHLSTFKVISMSSTLFFMLHFPYCFPLYVINRVQVFHECLCLVSLVLAHVLGTVNVIFPPVTGIICLSQNSLFEVVHLYLTNDWRDWKTQSSPMDLEVVFLFIKKIHPFQTLFQHSNDVIRGKRCSIGKGYILL